jgi:hypothetical protein
MKLQVQPGIVLTDEEKADLGRVDNTCCDAYNSGWGCTRKLGHQGRHIADGIDHEVYAAWEN